jgi:hypothetical protein
MEVALGLERKAELAGELLDNELLKEIFKEIRSELGTLWVNSGTDEVKKREFIWQYLRAVAQFEGRLAKYINEAKLERKIADLKLREEGEVIE